jgi:large subunit ribosomal protein L10
MPTPQKEKIVAEYSEKFSRASSVLLADFKGVDVATDTKLRRLFREHNVEYKVLKNTLAKIALNNNDIYGLDEYLNGVNGFAISYDDPTAAAKVLSKFEDKDKLSLRVCLFEGVVFGPDRVDDIANLPSREELLATLLSTLKAPMSNFAAVLAASMQNVVGVLEAVKDKKSE